jgi:hypothetical protein
MADVPNVFHFVFGLKPQTEPFHLLHYLCLASCLAVNRPDAIRFHHRHTPYGPWWDRIRAKLELVPIVGDTLDHKRERYRDSVEGRIIERLDLAYAHESDFIRLDALIAEGGIYADMDTLFVRPYPDAWRALPFAIGEELATVAPSGLIAPSLCNAVMFSAAGAAYARRWRARMAEAFDGTWSAHSCREAARLWGEHPDEVRVLPSTYFYRYGASRAGLATLLEDGEADPCAHDDLYSVHLWAHLWWAADRTDFSLVHAGEIDETWIRTRDTTLARLARSFLDAG